MPWKETSVVSERAEFVRWAETKSVSFSELCSRFGVSRQTGYRWLGRYRTEGSEGLADRSRRPRISPTQTAPEIEALVVALRRQHPRWGGRKIVTVLERQGHQQVPAPSTVTGILRRHGLLSSPPRPQAYQTFERPAPNQLWQMDFKGWFGCADRTICHPFGLLDDHSRFNLSLGACPDQKTGTVKNRLTAAFSTYGLPDQLLCDNGPPWGNTYGLFWTPLTVWLTDLGVEVIHSRPAHPQTAGKEERFHLTLDWEVISTRTVWDDLPAVQSAFDDWRPVYNYQRPHDALGLGVPADRYQPSPRSMPATLDPVDYPDHYQVRKVSTTAKIHYQGRRIPVPKAFKGRYLALRPTLEDGVIELLYRHHLVRTITIPDR